jgi:CheY-like chemotaxis protein
MSLKTIPARNKLYGKFGNMKNSEKELKKIAPSRAMSILLVDDKKTNILLLEVLVKQITACRSESAMNGLEALEKLSQKAFDLVFMDCHMPIMDGRETVTEIRSSARSYSDVPIICTSSKHRESLGAACSTCGSICKVNEILGKPFNECTIGKIIERYRNRDIIALQNSAHN